MDAVGRQRASFNKVDVLAATRVERRVQHLRQVAPVKLE